jgi:cell division protein FtsQ
LRPPHTLVIRIVERVPIGAIASDSGWDVVDAAGVVLSSSVAAPKAFPRLNIEGVDSAGFTAVVRALLALPPSLRGDVATISAETRDTVRLVLRGVPHEIRWGSDELSTLKAAVLERALEIASEKGGTFVIDVSAPDTLIMNRVN